MENIDFVKWWGAVLATLAFGWNIYNTVTNAPRLKVKLRPETSYPDARVIATEKGEHGESRVLATYCHIEITNTGRLPATVTNIEATHVDNGNGTLSFGFPRFQSHSPETLPLFIGPGQLWSCRLEMDDLYRLMEYGKPEIHITVSYKDKPFVAAPNIETKR
ncbi:hypothetical protein [Alloalcanivorax venustensis]|uniref:hypothetical protein n=1 Tax=Alloalcanivorax venustensis TaxID=172371 RepID=UPI001891BCC8|nr:hypothetical protein [Alloalcanivorax venustensis]